MPNDSSQKKDNLKQQAVSSTAWGFLDKGSNVIASFIIGIVLARLLPPSDFGLIGLAMIIIGFGHLFVNLGLGPALIQKQDITDRHIRMVFTTSVIAGIILMLTVYLSAPVTAVIFDNNNIVPIVEVLSVIFVLGGCQIPSTALLKKRLDFRHIFYISIGQSILYGILTITLALLGFGVWSLVVGNIFQSLATLLGSYWYTRHSLRPLLAKSEFSDLVHFGSGETLSSIFNYLALKGDFFIIGRLLGAEVLGLYTRSYNLMQQPARQIVKVLADVLFPAASRIRNDKERLEKIFLKTMSAIAFVALPICTILVILAPELIIGLYGKKWTGAVVPLQILGIFGVFRALYKGGAAFLRAKGWIFPIFWAQVAYGVSMIVGVWIGAHFYGLNVAVFFVGIAITILWFIIMELNISAQKINRKKAYGTLVPGIILAALLTISLSALKVLTTQFGGSYFENLIILTIASLILLLFIVLYAPQSWFRYMPRELLIALKKYIPDTYYNWIIVKVSRKKQA